MSAFIRLAALAAATMSATAALAAPITLYDGGALPTAQGWNHAGDNATVTVGAGTTQFVTVNNPPGQFISTSQYSSYAYATGATNFVVSIRLQVNSAGHNPLDSGLGFSAFGRYGGIQADRWNDVSIVNGTVFWGDETASATVGNASGFHDYTLRYQNGVLDLFFDSEFADVVSGSATSILSRTAVPYYTAWAVGTIVFGDMTNDSNVNSDYVVDYVNFQDLDAPAPVPEPAMLGLFGLGAIGLAAARRRKA